MWLVMRPRARKGTNRRGSLDIFCTVERADVFRRNRLRGGGLEVSSTVLVVISTISTTGSGQVCISFVRPATFYLASRLKPVPEGLPQIFFQVDHHHVDVYLALSCKPNRDN
jgi:hypothetical protein